MIYDHTPSNSIIPNITDEDFDNAIELILCEEDLNQRITMIFDYENNNSYRFTTSQRETIKAIYRHAIKHRFID